MVEEDLQKFIKENSNKYFIKKRNGSLREVWQPSYKVKEIQKWIYKNILNDIQVSECVHGFVKNRSILTNAQNHIHEDKFWVFSMDIKNFFPSIRIERIEQIFLKLGYSLEVSKALSLLCTVDGKLVQGFPTSPSLSNIIMREIDEEFKTIADRYNLKYSRYADDITFSGDQKKGYLILVKRLEKMICFILKNADFEINNSKTRLMKNKHAKIVTGLIVDSDGVRIPKKYIRKLKKEIYYCKKFGVNEHLKYIGLITIANYKGYLFGLARYIYMVEKELGIMFIKQLNDLEWD
ncbi:reverse transcriptase family protein [Bacillus toyonensis]|uniref:reverse transcriptase family protein n=1 Tax=Bacillus toyonensis TaxID=155322 RepID=UPI001C55572F|nr:reverse transcriptase family protein [Bacillus toyonensis]